MVILLFHSGSSISGSRLGLWDIFGLGSGVWSLEVKGKGENV